MYDLEKKEDKSFPEKILSVFGAIGSFIFGSIEAIVIALAISVVLYLFILTPHEVIGKSMYPTFKNGQYLLANKLAYKLGEIHRGDVIIFKHSETYDYIKRVIGLPGEQLSLRDGKIYINGTVLDESNYLSSSVITNGGNYLHEGETITVPEGKVFVCGDNRPGSSDSREFGPIEQSVIKGKVWVTYYPFSDFNFNTDPKYSL